ncbi:MAG: hypothetical protein OXG85_14615 [Chloroflexi bacterium]|nr:hypothetical protein [Chloroflexota bacterium]
MLIEVPDEVAARLQEMAEARRITVGEMVDILIIRDQIAAERNRRENAELFRRTEEKAAAEARAISDLKPGDEGWPPPGSLAALAENARKADLGALSRKKVDTSARSREILNAEFPDYIRRHQANEHYC